MNLKEKQLNSKLVYKGKIVNLYVDKVLCPNGNEATREVIRHCKAVAVIASIDNKFIMEYCSDNRILAKEYQLL